jgi:hypothetical protein
MRLNHRVLIMLGAGLFGATLVGCQEDNEKAFARSAPAANQVGSGKDAPPKDQRAYYEQQKSREGGMKNYPGKK